MKARLSRKIERQAFEELWKSEQQGPPVIFEFTDDGLTVTADRWDPQSLRQTIQIAIHKMESTCEIDWVEASPSQDSMPTL